MERRRGSPLLLAALLLLTGLHVKAEMSTERPQSTQTTSLASTLVATANSQPAVSREDNTTVTPFGTASTTFQTNEPESKATTESIEGSSVSGNDTVSATTNTKVSPISTNNSSDTASTTVTPSTMISVSANPNLTSSDNMTSLSTVSEPSTLHSTEHTSGPTESSTKSPTTVTETQTGSTNQTGNTTSASIITKSVNASSEPVTEKTSQSSGTDSSPTLSDSPSVPELTQASKTQTSASRTDMTTEHEVELSKALSPGSVAAITIIVIALVLVIFGGAAYWKIRHSSYGRLLEDQDYGSLGNYNNPLYDDS